MSRSKPILSLACILLLSALACSMPTRQTLQPTSTPAPTVDPQEMESLLATAEGQLLETGSFSITFTEEQITAYVAAKLAQEPDAPFTDPRFTLSNGQMILSGSVKVGFLTGQAQIVFEPALVDGRLQVSILSANFGSIPFPESALQQITDNVNQNMSDFISVNGRSVRIQTLEIGQGTMTLSGTTR